jgi:hypothetical protein
MLIPGRPVAFTMTVTGPHAGVNTDPWNTMTRWV